MITSNLLWGLVNSLNERWYYAYWLPLKILWGLGYWGMLLSGEFQAIWKSKTNPVQYNNLFMYKFILKNLNCLCYRPYSGKLSREKSFTTWEPPLKVFPRNFRHIMPHTHNTIGLAFHKNLLSYWSAKFFSFKVLVIFVAMSYSLVF